VLDPVPAVVWAFGWLLAIASIHTFPSGFGDAGQPMDTSGSGHATFWTRWFSAGSERVIDPDWADRREARVSTGATGLALALVIASMAAGQKPPSVSADGGVGLGLVAVICLLGGTREVISARLRMKLVASLSTQAYEDPLTGLPNRRALTRRICATPPEQAWTVVTVDIDGFKQVNDALGHAGGDQILIQVAQVLCRIAQAPGMPARTGADEFALLCQGDVVAGEALAHRLLGEVSDVLAQSGGGLTLSVSAGVGRLVPHSQAQQRDDDRLSALVESAAALRSAKSQGRGQVGVFTEALAAARDRHALVERRLTQAVTQAQISVVAQPLVYLDSGALHGVEALARWTDADLGVVGPDEFIPVAESAGLILALGRQVLCTAVARGRSDGLFDAGIQVGVNVSPLQLLTPDFVPLVRALLDEHAVPGPSLVLEVTEAILVAEDDDTMRSLAHLKDAGVHLAIDDFGSGYSALNYLRRLPVDVVKIDRTWTVASMHDERTRSIVESVNALAHKLGAHVVMEGIEDEATAAMCREVGADLGQGWHFGRPQSYQDIMASLRAGRPGGQAIPAPR
jgi:diguanylate cyclase (GGDEF)-like protein